MRFILVSGFICFWVLFSHSQVKTISFYFQEESTKLAPTSLNDISNFKDLLLEKDIQVIEINGFVKEGTKSNPKNLAQKRIDYILETFQFDEVQFSTNAFGLVHEAVSFSINNWDRVDLYFFQGRKKRTPLEQSNDSIPLITKEVIKQIEPIIPQTPESKLPSLSSVKFIGGTKKIQAKAYPQLEALRDTLINNEELTIEIRGHVCCEDKMRLSKKRAKAVYKYLVKEEIEKRRLSYKGYSNSLPLAFPEETNKDREANRRVDVVFTNFPSSVKRKKKNPKIL